MPICFSIDIESRILILITIRIFVDCSITNENEHIRFNDTKITGFL
jgi:hypothetical protein